MSQKDAYKLKIEAELELVQAKLAEMKAIAKSSVADAQIQYGKIVDDLEVRLDNTKSKLKDLGSASEDAWESLKDGVEGAWSELSKAVHKAGAKFKS